MTVIEKKDESVTRQVAGFAVFAAVAGGAVYASRNPEKVAQLGQEAMKYLNTLYSSASSFSSRDAFNYAVAAGGRLSSSAKDLFVRFLNPAQTPVISFEKK